MTLNSKHTVAVRQNYRQVSTFEKNTDDIQYSLHAIPVSFSMDAAASGNGV